MSKITLNSVGSLIDATTAQATINNNSNTIQTAFDNTLSRDGTSPNSMAAPLDMSSNPIINLPAPVSMNSPLRLADANTLNGGGTVTGLPAGGTTGQPLVKSNNTDYQVTWAPITGTGSVVNNTSPTLVTPNLGTPSAAVLTNATGLPVTTGVSGLGTGVATFLTTPTSANLKTAVTDETGTGSLVFSDNAILNNTTLNSPTISTPSFNNATLTGTVSGGATYTSPTFTTPALGTPASGVLTNCTSLNATQLTTGTVPTAAMPNYGALTTTTSMTIAAGSGTITSASGTLRYQTRGKQTFFQLSITITNNGTGATSVQVSGLPWTFGSDCVVCGRATTGTGKLLQGYGISGTSAITIWNYDNTYPASTGEIIKLTGVIENT